MRVRGADGPPGPAERKTALGAAGGRGGGTGRATRGLWPGRTPGGPLDDRIMGVNRVSEEINPMKMER